MLMIVQKVLDYSHVVITYPAASKAARDAHFGLKRVAPAWADLGDPLYNLVQSVRLAATALDRLPRDQRADAVAALVSQRRVLERYAECLPPSAS